VILRYETFFFISSLPAGRQAMPRNPYPGISSPWLIMIGISPCAFGLVEMKRVVLQCHPPIANFPDLIRIVGL